jgi:drug/metabolite transporter (DMT)-like permease
MEIRGAVYAAAAAMLYGSAYVATAIALRSYTPFAAAAWRGLLGTLLLAGLLLVPALAAQRPGRLTSAALTRLGALGVLGGAIFILALNGAVSTAGATVTAFVAGLYAVLAAVFAIPLLGERIERRTLVALTAALVGTVLLSDLRAEARTLTGIGIALVGAAAFGLFLVLSRRWSAAYGLTGPTIGIATMTIGAAVALVALAVAGEPLVPTAPRTDATLAIGWLAVGPGAAASVLVVAGMRRLPARRASVFLLLNPPTAAVLALLLLGQALSPLQLVGAACILGAIAVASGAVPTRTAFRRSSRPGSAPLPRS